MSVQPDDLIYDDKGLLPAIVQDAVTGKVLTLAYMNKESLQKTLETGKPGFIQDLEKPCGIKEKLQATNNSYRKLAMTVTKTPY